MTYGNPDNGTDSARAYLFASQLLEDKRSLSDALEALAKVLERRLNLEGERDRAQLTYEGTRVLTERAIVDRHVIKDKAKTYLIDISDDGEGEPIQVTADEARDWIAVELRKDPNLEAARAVAQKAATEYKIADHDLELARERLKNARAELVASEHHLDALVALARLEPTF